MEITYIFLTLNSKGKEVDSILYCAKWKKIEMCSK